MRRNRRTPPALLTALSSIVLVLAAHTGGAATDVSSTSFVIDPALPEFDDPLAENPLIVGYSPVSVGSSFQLPGGPPYDSDYLDVIFTLSLGGADDGSTLLRILSDNDGGNSIVPQFLRRIGT